MVLNAPLLGVTKTFSLYGWHSALIGFFAFDDLDGVFLTFLGYNVILEPIFYSCSLLLTTGIFLLD
jgi:hypothetical protein